MKKNLIFALMIGLFCFATNQSLAQGNTTIELPFDFVTDDGCGDYAVSGTFILTFTENGVTSRYNGTATELATGETVPLRVRTTSHNNKNGFTSVLSVVFPSKVSVHSVFHVNFRGGNNPPNIVIQSKVNCN